MSVTAIRFQMKANAMKGIFGGPGGQLLRLNPSVVHVDLSRTMTWSEENAGDLVIQGKWHEISAAIGSATGMSLQSKLDGRRSAVDKEMDDMFGPLPGDDAAWLAKMDSMPFYVSGQMGAEWTETTSQGEVVADPRGEMVKLFAGRAAGVLGTAAPIPESMGGVAIASVGAAKDLTGMTGPGIVAKAKQTREERRRAKFDGSDITITVGTQPSSSSFVVCTKEVTLSNTTLLLHAVNVMAELWKG